jgi:penicillin amidase
MKVVRVLRRIGVGLLVTVLAVLTLGVGGAVLAVRASFPDYDGSLRLKGLAAPVEVYRDAQGVPQVYAQRPADLFRAQGYLHAQDRFWEMDFRRHVTSGRLAEMFGESQVETDAYIRTMGWRRVAEKEFALLAPDTRRWLEAYADGVNGWLAGRSSLGASLEYGVLKLQNPGYRVEKWDPVDSVAWLKAMAWDLRGNMSDELERAELLAAGLSREQVDELYPAYPAERHAPILATGGVRAGVFDPAAPTSEQVGAPPPAAPGGVAGAAALAGVRRGLARLPALLGPNGHGIGSNSWVLAGSRTRSGRPLLANDPHLAPSAPGTWYQMGLHCADVTPECPFDVSGYTFSGLPGVVIGHNARIAWGFTNLGPDVVDLCLERVDGDSYERDGRAVKLAKRTETIKVAGGKPVRIEVRSTGNGPLLSDRAADLRRIGAKPAVSANGTPADEAAAAAPKLAVALRWTALEPGRTLDALFGVNTARDWPSFRAAVRRFAVPAQNMVYADVDGNVGYQTPGDIPVRDTGDGRWPVPGWLSAYDWRGRVPFDALPSVLNPPAGYVATANQAVVRPGYPYLLTADWDYGYRSQRIADLVTAERGKVNAADVARSQLDSRNGNAEQLVPYLLAVEVPGRARAAQDLLRGWDLQQPANSAPAAFFNATWRHLLERTFDELPADHGPDGGARWFEVVRGLAAEPGSRWWDERDTERPEQRDDVLRAAMVDAYDELAGRFGGEAADWRWGDLHTLTLRNASLGESGIAPVEWLFNRGPYPAPGGDSVVNATGWTAPDGYEVDWVPSMRMVVDLGDLDRSRWVNLAGASGHAFHRYYTDQVELWRTGETTPMRSERRTIEREARHRLSLMP